MMSSLSQNIDQNNVQKISENLMSLVSQKNGHNDSSTKINRIKTLAAFRKLGGGDKLPVDFEVRDLVIVHGWLGCSRGAMLVTLEDSLVHFRIDIVKHCSHMTMQLRLMSYSASFSISKDLAIAPQVIVGKPGINYRGRGLPLGHKLDNPNADYVSASGCDLTDEDIEKLKYFKKLVHLDLSNNRITDKGLVHLSHMKTLRDLNLGDNPGISDAGIDHLRLIASSSRSQMINLEETAITLDGVKSLQKWAGEHHESNLCHSLVEVTEHTGILSPSEKVKIDLL